MIADTSENPIDGEPTKTPGTVEDNAGIGEVAWSNPGNAKLPDGESATYTPTKGAKQISHYLLAKNFGFALPTGATVIGIAASYQRETTVIGGFEDSVVRLVKAGIVVGQNKASPTPVWGNLRTAKYGSSTDLWETPWTVAQINSSEFGVVLAVASHVSGFSASVDAITITVAYSEAANENRVCFASRSVEFTDTGVRRQHVSEEVWGDVPAPLGMLLKAPAPGQADKDARLLVIPTVGDLDTRPDSAAPLDVGVKVSYRPGYLFAREAAE
jgi:hypothetical protein